MADLWNLHQRAVLFDGRRRAHWTQGYTGDRWSIILFNPDMSYHDNFEKSDGRILIYADERTEMLRGAPPADTQEVARVENDAQGEAYVALINALRAEKRWARKGADRSHTAKYAQSPSTTIQFGMMRRRDACNGRSKAVRSKADERSPELLAAVRCYLNEMLGEERVAFYSAIFILNQ